MTVSLIVLKAPWFQRLKLLYDGPLSNLAFIFDVRRYSEVYAPARCGDDTSEEYVTRCAGVGRCSLTQ
jgi:hypothetical protein